MKLLLLLKLFTQPLHRYESCSNIFWPIHGIMRGLEEKALLEWAMMDPTSIPLDWWRFIDDILFWWTGTLGDLLIFINFMNSVHPSIKFTYNFNFATRSVNFLDMRIWVDDEGYISLL